jgi:hypothetical protein
MIEVAHVPAHYRPKMRGKVVFWGHLDSESLAIDVVPPALARIEQLLGHHLERRLHVVAYSSHAEACEALNRRLSVCGLMAPLHTETYAVLVLIGPNVDPRNGDRRRMYRHICHELAHVFSAERTASVKHLGDGDRGMRVRSWVNEGFAENVAATVAERPDIIEAAVHGSAGLTMSPEAMDAAFRDLESADRALAFAFATVQIWRAVHRHGYPYVFENLACDRAW